jgi:hypothetical protein
MKDEKLARVSPSRTETVALKSNSNPKPNLREFPPPELDTVALKIK